MKSDKAVFADGGEISHTLYLWFTLFKYNTPPLFCQVLLKIIEIFLKKPLTNHFRCAIIYECFEEATRASSSAG